MKKADLRKLVREASDAELEKLLADTRKDLFHFCHQRSTKQLEQAHRIRESRKQVARILEAQTARQKMREAS